MKLHAALLGCLSVVLVFSLAATAFCVEVQDGGKKGPEEKFKALDKDGDGKVTLEEYTKDMNDKQKASAEKRFKKADADEDGSLSLDEFKKAAGKGGKGGKKKKKE